MLSAAKKQGKSGGARVITFLETVVLADEETQTVNLIYIYDKADAATISQKELSALIKHI